MRIAFISDTHLGYKWGDSELGMDSINQTRAAFVGAIEEKVDLIIHPGDIFDTKIPKPEVWVEALKIFALPAMAEDSGVEPVSQTGNTLHFKGIPVIAIHGNHERRGGSLKNPVEALDAAGLVIYLKSNSIVLKKGDEKVNIFGMGYVPESYVVDTLAAIDAKPIDGAFNIFVMHQNVKEYLPDEVSFLSVHDLPKFDLIANGHIHHNDFKTISGGVQYIMPGSTVATQIKREEAARKKGFYVYDTEKRDAEFIEIEPQRPIIFEDMKFVDSESDEVFDKIRDKLDNILSNEFPMKPIVKFKLSGSIKVGRTVDKVRLEKEFSDKTILMIDNQLESEEFEKKIEELRVAQMQKKGSLGMGVSFLETQLKSTDYSGPNISDIFDLMVEGELDELLGVFLKHYQHIESTNIVSQ